MKKIYLILLLILTAFSSSELFAGATNYPFTSNSVTPGDVTGCAVTNYTFTQTTANANGAKITAGVMVTILFPGGVNLTTATMAGSTFKGTPITAGWNITGQTLTFTAPTGIGKNVSFNIVIANVTNGNNINANASVSIPNNSGVPGVDSESNYNITTTACPVVPGNNDCGSPTVLTPPAAGSSVCTTTSGTTFGATASTPAVCTGQADDDVWYRFTANGANHQVTVDGIAGFNAVVQVLSGTCAGTLTSMACINATGSDGIETANLTGLTAGTQYFVRIYHNGVGAGVLAANSFTVCVTSAPPAAGCAGIGAGNLTAASLPYTSGAQTTCGAGDDITSTNAAAVCGSTLYYGGEDKVITFTPAATGNLSVNLTSTGSYVGMMLYQGCPVSGGTCVASAQSYSGNQSIGCAPVTAGQTYYLVVDSWPTPTCNPFNVTISAPTGGIPPGTTCANPVNMTLPYLANNESTLCFGDDYTNSTTGVGTTSYMSGEDKVYKFVTTGPDCISINITNANTSYVGFHVFSGCPGAGGTLLGRAEYATSGALSGSVTLPGAGTYYVIVDTYSLPSSVNYNISVTSLGTGPANDAICSATALTLGSAAGGDNNCTGSTGEPANPACWTATGTMNTVWYSVVVPASGKLRIRATSGSLTNPQIALYTGTCAAPVYNSCNTDVASCSGFVSNDAELLVTGLTAGNTVFVRVDGYGSMTGTFSILAIDGNSTITPVPGQDCGDPNPVCNTVMAVSNPGYSGYGNICDLPTSYCLASGERNVVWYRVPVSVAGTLNFDIVPNDFVSSSESETDYDFAIWETVDAGATVATCAQIAAGTAPPDACNYSFLGVTGVGAGGNPPSSLPTTVCPSCPGGYNPSTTYSGAYEPTINADANDVYLIAISNFISSTAGFRIRFTGTATIDFAQGTNSAAVTWSGGDVSGPTVWTDVDNWGGCAAPSCTRDAFVAPFNNQPVLVTGNTYSVRDITIQAGASLTLQANSVLEVCGNFYNYGTITADPTSTIRFIGTAAAGQVIAGNLTGSNKFGNLTVLKNAASGVVTLLNDIEIGGTMTTSNATSILNSNGKYVTLGKHFTNYGGFNTFTNIGATGTLEFNGTGAQNYDESTGTTDTLALNFVIVNNTAAAGSGVALTNCNMSIKATTGTLTLTAGTITTTNSYQVSVFNKTPACVSTGTTASYVDGNLRRFLNGSGDYNWPVGNVAKGFQRARTNFSTTNINFIDSRFDAWPASPYTQAGAECTYTYDQVTEDNGYWTMKSYTGAGAIGGTGTYDCTLYPLNATNTTGMSAWTIIKRSSATAIDGTGWALNGTCSGSGTATQTTRTGMTNFSFLAVDQALATLPIELLSFTGENEGLHNILKWTTAAERENDFFTLERSQNGYDFTFLAEVDGAGNSSSLLNYHSYDFNPYPGVTYYRLKQTNFNGEFTYSNIVALTNELDKITVSEAYPNPTNGDVSIDFFSPVNGSIELKMFDKTGRIIFEESKSVNGGNNPINLNMEGFAKGVYTLEINFDKANFKNLQKLVRN